MVSQRRLSRALGLIYVFCGILVVTMPCPAQTPQRLSLIEKQNSNVPKELEKSYQTLAAYLAKPARNDVDKAWAFYNYAASSLRGPAEGEIWSSEPLELLGKTRVASCAGYAEVFRGLCLAGGLKAVCIRGYARGGGWQLGDKVKIEVPNHSWNAVLIDRQWRLVDSSWKMFFPPSEVFIYTHLPLAVSRHNIHKYPGQPQEEWQLLKRPLSVQEWESLPRVDEAFFRCHLALLNPQKAVFAVRGNQALVDIGAVPNVSLRADLIEGRKTVPVPAHLIRRYPNGYRIGLVFPQEGIYTLRVFAALGNPDGAHDFALDCQITATNNGPPDIAGGVAGRDIVAAVYQNSPRQKDTVFDDFENGYGQWTVEGTSFGQSPANGGLPGQQAVIGYYGKSLVNSFLQGDDSTGTMISRPFKINRNYLRFLIGGGARDGLQIRLLIAGKTVRRRSGYDNEELLPYVWDVSEFRGKEARLEIVDEEKGPWGHINVDHIEHSDLPINISALPPSGPIVPE